MEKRDSTANSVISANTGIESNNTSIHEYSKPQAINKKNNRYPFCIVWTPIPLISWLIPVIGHTGICTSDGKIHDFAGSYFVSIDNMAFGNPHKYVPLNQSNLTDLEWDDCIAKADERFEKEEHNLILNNCHSHVAHALNTMNYKGKNNYNMIYIWFYCIAYSKYVSWFHILKTYFGFIFILAMIMFFRSL